MKRCESLDFSFLLDMSTESVLEVIQELNYIYQRTVGQRMTDISKNDEFAIIQDDVDITTRMLNPNSRLAFAMSKDLIKSVYEDVPKNVYVKYDDISENYLFKNIMKKFKDLSISNYFIPKEDVIRNCPELFKSKKYFNSRHRSQESIFCVFEIFFYNLDKDDPVRNELLKEVKLLAFSLSLFLYSFGCYPDVYRDFKILILEKKRDLDNPLPEGETRKKYNEVAVKHYLINYRGNKFIIVSVDGEVIEDRSSEPRINFIEVMQQFPKPYESEDEKMEKELYEEVIKKNQKEEAPEENEASNVNGDENVTEENSPETEDNHEDAIDNKCEELERGFEKIKQLFKNKAEEPDSEESKELSLMAKIGIGVGAVVAVAAAAFAVGYYTRKSYEDDIIEIIDGTDPAVFCLPEGTKFE